MRPSILRLTLAFLSTLCFASIAAAQTQLWTPQRDDVFLQEVGYQVKTETPVRAVAVLGDEVFAALDQGVVLLRGKESLAKAQGAPEGRVAWMTAAGNALWVQTEDGLHRYADGVWDAIAEGVFADVIDHAGEAAVVAPSALYRAGESGLEVIPGSEAAPFPIGVAASYAETIYCFGAGGGGSQPGDVAVFDGKDYTQKRVIDLGDLAEGPWRDALAFGSQLLLASPKGLGVIRGTAATLITGADGLPCIDVRGLARGFGRDYWLATAKGAVRAVDGEYHFFTGSRWLPGDDINAIACGPRTAYIATDGGLGIIDYEPYTLLKKAAYYERHLDEWGQKRMAFVHKLEWNADKGGWVREVSDNDVGWSTHWWAAQAFKFAVTGDPQARQNAIDGFNTLKWSEEITSIDGFPARSIWAVGETGNRATGGSGGYPAEWNPTDDGKWAWKGDTSSDETDAHYYYASIFYELVADDALREQVRDHVRRVSTHIIDNGWTLRDLDGKPTVWARWDPEYFAGKGKLARGLNGLEILNYMRTTHALTGEQKYADAVQQLVDMDYLDQVIYQKLVMPIHIFHSDDRLAFYNYYTLLQYETEPRLRSYYMRSLERSYEIERIEHIPWFNFIYGAVTGHDCETAQSVKHLREWPLDMIPHGYNYKNRADLQTPSGYVPYCQVVQAISPREIGPVRWTDNMGRLENGSSHTVREPSGWLDAYWMGRYHGFILPPETNDPALTTVAERNLQLGAAPYDGPPMPNVLQE